MNAGRVGVGGDPAGQRERGVGEVAEQERVVARGPARPGDVRVQLEELRVVEEVHRVVDHGRVGAGAVRRRDQLGDQAWVELHRGHRPPVGIVDLEGDDQGRDADRRVDDASALGRVGVERVDDQADVAGAGRHVAAGLRLTDGGVVEGDGVRGEPAGLAAPRRQQVGGHGAALDTERGSGQRAGVLDGEELQRHDGALGPGPRGVQQVLGVALRPPVVGHHDDRARRGRVAAEAPRTRAW